MNIKKTVTLCLLVASTQLAAFAHQQSISNASPKRCQAEQLIAHYEQTFGEHHEHANIATHNPNHNHNQAQQQKSTVQQLTLLRKGNRVAHYNPEQKVANIWYLNRHKQQQLTRVFERYQQGIEYQADELKAQQQWHYVRTLVDHALLASMSHQKASGAGCQRLEHYTLATATHEFQLQWLPALALPQSLVVTDKQTHQTSRLQLVDIEYGDKVVEQFTVWDALPTTDYADVGDNENNPFLAKMINQGFSGSPNAHAHHHH
ncbi:hypothetical protein DXX93_19210 [Thalassotalea euphylliae]|uniref:Uncharacterized protein n=1 Tax=Thalassotalea euphylliae TaxID=1655234 RepID=A0A3E0TVK7_9GAMM|nr:hypothetical protein [Thalassotalea euphylliae]REL28484.1 hypothetical protein DXX93_19210 [Thalassotalea euphylliae]